MLTAKSARIRAARALTRRRIRAAEGQFLAEGPQAVREALARPGTVTELFVSASAARRYDDLLDAAQRDRVAVHEADDAALASLSETVTPQGVVAVCRSPLVPLVAALDSHTRLAVVLAQVRDPGNAGTVIRAADAAGAQAVVFSGDAVDPLGGKCVRASAGSLFHVALCTGEPTPAVVAAARDHGLNVLAADGSGDLDLDDATDSGLLAQPTAWLFGNEAWGLPSADRSLADHVVRVPIYGHAESLNLATAAAVCLYASARAQR